MIMIIIIILYIYYTCAIMHTCFCDTYIWYKILHCEYCANNCPLWFLPCNGCDGCCSAGARPPTLRRAAIAGGDCDHPKAQENPRAFPDLLTPVWQDHARKKRAFRKPFHQVSQVSRWCLLWAVQKHKWQVTLHISDCRRHLRPWELKPQGFWGVMTRWRPNHWWFFMSTASFYSSLVGFPCWSDSRTTW